VGQRCRTFTALLFYSGRTKRAPGLLVEMKRGDRGVLWPALLRVAQRDLNPCYRLERSGRGVSEQRNGVRDAPSPENVSSGSKRIAGSLRGFPLPCRNPVVKPMRA
jgi:hypothetical protein